MFTLLGCFGFISGFLSGLLGIGGGIVMAPLLLYLPPLFGLEPLPMRVVAGLTIVQGLLGCLFGALSHRRFRFVSGPLSITMGVSIFLAAVIGGAGSNHVSNEILLFLFACLALCASSLMFLSNKEDIENPDVDELVFSRIRAVASASGVGLIGGLVGQGGSFILIPLMISFVKIPTRIAIGSNLAVVTASTFAGFIGKAFTGQIEWLLTIPVIITVIPATYLGSLLSRRVPTRMLKKILSILIAAAAIRIWISFLSPGP